MQAQKADLEPEKPRGAKPDLERLLYGFFAVLDRKY